MDSTTALVQSSWPTVEALGVETVGILFFKRVFEIAPDALQMFSFKDEENVSRGACKLCTPCRAPTVSALPPQTGRCLRALR